MAANLKGLIGKLNDTTRNALEAAAGFCLARTHYDIEIEHFLVKLLDAADSDFPRILKHFGVNQSRLTSDLTRSLDKLKSGNARTPAFSPSLVQMFSEAWNTGSLDFGAAQIRTGFCILAAAATPDLARMIREVTREFQLISPENLQKDFWTIVAGSPEDSETAQAAGMELPGTAPGAGPGSKTKTPNLDQFTQDLTGNAKAGKIDAVLGRDAEIRQIIDILTRRRQNNPILTGEAGVGKTAVVEGFALRVAAGDVPPPLKNVTIRSLDLALLQAGAGIKGEFENRLKGLIEEVKKSPTPIIIFIDEAHTLIGAGGQAGQGDAANLLKPALARGELRTIAATTWSEYKKYFEKDPALARRFQVVKVEEPTEQQCMVMLRGIVNSLEKHHKVRILDEAVQAATKFSHRYLAGRQLPDKAVSVLDTACARLSLGQNATPPLIEDTIRQLDDLEVQTRVLERESAVGADHAERLTVIAKQQEELSSKLKVLQERREKEFGLVSRIREMRTQLESAAAPAPAGSGTAAQPAIDAPALRAELNKLNGELEKLQGENPLMRVCVDTPIVGEVISAWTGIPVGRMQQDEIKTVLNLKGLLAARVVGQDLALEAVSQRIQTSRAGMDDPVKPVGVFMLVGPSGVGKTETALALADLLYGGERNLITINMSEYQEAHTVSSLKGSPPGYVGYGEGGVLTEAVRRRPYSVVLLDEVEKAHPDVLELFFQVFDKGMMEDGEGREIDFKNTIIILTSNACTDLLMKLTADPETMPSSEGLAKALKPELNKIFKPAFMGRLVTVPYFPLRDETMKNIVRLKLGKICRRIRENHKIELTYTDTLVDEVAKRCTEVESGARNVDNILTNTMLPDVSRYLLNEMAERRKPSSIHVSVGANGNFEYAS
ncbi:MAG TPA: type VI secretion system ATPase TssH [Candidatus Sulfotelmatobacter sp.]|nr:type VI secretion system ATPase TssH [Candidatus Sulfotelmatobacter sp.]